MELHYDDVHLQRWREREGKAPQRKGEYRVFQAVAQAHRQKLCQRLELPKSVKEIMRGPKDETRWEKVEELSKKPGELKRVIDENYRIRIGTKGKHSRLRRLRNLAHRVRGISRD